MANMFDTKEFHDKYYYDGALGALYTKRMTEFRVWAPTASKVVLNLFREGLGDNQLDSLDMTPAENGTWVYKMPGDQNGIYYTYNVTVNGETNEVVDPYAKAVGANGLRGMVLDLRDTDPRGFRMTERPRFGNCTPADAVVYETHVRDFSNHYSARSNFPGKFLAFTETGNMLGDGTKIGVDHLKELGVTHVQLLPTYDYYTVDETKLDKPQFNWGYDPLNYNAPEGSYSTDSYDGSVRITEYKQMVQSLHRNGIRVIMDVVYNHTMFAEKSYLNMTVPHYYHRTREDGTFYDGSACTNETASDRPMCRKYIVDSVVYWATEYMLDGFRFDLMGIHDIETMNEIRRELDRVDPTIIVYGEGWTGGECGIPDSLRALKCNAKQYPKVGAFSDDIRDGIKGHVFNLKEKGFVSGAQGFEETVKFGLVGCIDFPSIDMTKVNYSKQAWAANPSQAVNYVEAHDNLTIWDKLATSNPEDDEATRIKMDKLAAGIVFTAQGISFIQLGQDFLRTKYNEVTGEFDENSFRSPDKINNIDWRRKAQYRDVFEYYKGLIAFRKAHQALRYNKRREVVEHLHFLDCPHANMIAFTATAENEMIVIYNANRDTQLFQLPDGEWDVYINEKQAGTKLIETVSGAVKIAGISMFAAVRKTR
ncbi:MAG: type I pullulanase [Clostridia bacterium]|nr:type I pullulanase [Clostridia bacterium]